MNCGSAQPASTKTYFLSQLELGRNIDIQLYLRDTETHRDTQRDRQTEAQRDEERERQIDNKIESKIRNLRFFLSRQIDEA